MTDKQNKITFQDLREKIISSLNKKIEILGIQEGVTLVPRIINQPASIKLSNAIIIGGDTLPIVAVVGKETGLIYFFSLQSLIPEMDINA
jgi:hypothetical protein